MIKQGNNENMKEDPKGENAVDLLFLCTAAEKSNVKGRKKEREQNGKRVKV